MNIEYGSSKEVKCYRDFVLNPDNRNVSRAFSKTFGANLMEPAKKLHDRLRKYVSAGAYKSGLPLSEIGDILFAISFFTELEMVNR